MSGPTNVAPTAIVPASSEVWPALERLFLEGGDARSCWCQYWRLRSTDFAARRVSELRDALRNQTERRLPPGLVALRGDRAVGWLGLGPRADFERLERSRTIPRIEDAADGGTWAIACFVVSRHARGEGLALTLLEAAIAFAAERGADALEAYPVEILNGATIRPEAAYTGTLSMFRRAGFRRVAGTASTAGRFPRVVVRRRLVPTGSAIASAQSRSPGGRGADTGAAVPGSPAICREAGRQRITRHREPPRGRVE